MTVQYYSLNYKTEKNFTMSYQIVQAYKTNIHIHKYDFIKNMLRRYKNYEELFEKKYDYTHKKNLILNMMNFKHC